MERARQVQGLAGRRVRRARPSESRAGTVIPLSVRTLTGGDVGIGRDVRPSYVQVGAGARMYGFTPRGGRALPSIRALDNMDTPLTRDHPAYPFMRDGDGDVVCESGSRSVSPASSPSSPRASGTGCGPYRNCTALRRDHPTGVPRGHCAYQRRMDPDNDGRACER